MGGKPDREVWGRVTARGGGRLAAPSAGLGRVMGVAAVCRLFGVLTPDEDGEADLETNLDNHVRLGIKLRRYRLTHDSSELEVFLQACRRAPLRWPDPSQGLASLATAARQVVLAVGRATSALQTRVDGYVADFLVRKLVLHRLVAEARAQRYIDWSATSLEQVRLISADSSDALGSLPPKWTAAEASWFLFDRPDWACFISMFACLWKEAAQACQGDVAPMVAACESDDFPLAVRSLSDSLGVVPRPLSALRICSPLL